MHQDAHVKSIDAIRDFRAALAQFNHDAMDALMAVDMQVRRTLDWLINEQPRYWQREVRVRGEKVAQARTDLSRARMVRATAEHVPECVEQKIALRRAEEHLREAEEKLRKVRQWKLLVEEAVKDYKGQAQLLVSMCDGDLVRAIGMLDRVLLSLEGYTQIEHAATQPAAVANAVETELERPTTGQSPEMAPAKSEPSSTI